jgi:hypothetical protein
MKIFLCFTHRLQALLRANPWPCPPIEGPLSLLFHLRHGPCISSLDILRHEWQTWGRGKIILPLGDKMPGWKRVPSWAKRMEMDRSQIASLKNLEISITLKIRKRSN